MLWRDGKSEIERDLQAEFAIPSDHKKPSFTISVKSAARDIKEMEVEDWRERDLRHSKLQEDWEMKRGRERKNQSLSPPLHFQN